MKSQGTQILSPLVCLILLSCGGSSNIRTKTETLPAAPIFLLVDKVISGELVGEKMSRPVGLAKNNNGDIIICDSGNHRLIKLDSEFNAKAEIGGPGTQAGLLSNPTFVTFDNNLNLLVTDEGNRRIVRYDYRLNYVDEIEFYNFDDPLAFGVGSGVATADYGETWVADAQNNQVAIFNNVGHFERFIGDFGYSGGQLRSPEKIILGSEGEFVVCDAGNSRLVIYDSYGNYDYEIKSDAFSYPVAVAEHGDNYWVVDQNASKIFQVDRRGNVLFMSQTTLIGNSVPLNQPSDILLLDDTHLMIADTGNDRVLVCRLIIDTD